MEPGPTPPAPKPSAPTPLSYAPPDPPRRVSWLDLGSHAMFALGLALVAGGMLGREYMGPSAFGAFVREYYLHMVMTGAFISGVLLSVRLGPFAR